MLKLGEKQVLVVVKRVEFGVYLAETMKNTTEKVLLPKRQVPEDLELGDPIEVFLYKDSEDRMIATTLEPKLTLGKVAKLTVSSVGKIGAFLDWGLPKDLLLPFRQQTTKVQKADQVLVTLYLDKSSRLCASMKVYHYLNMESPYKKGDEVTGMVYEISDNFGAFVAIDDQYSALIPKKELTRDVKVLDQITARVTAIKEDGKIDLSLRKQAHEMLSEDAEKILALLKKEGGFLPLHDKSEPELIREKTAMSKNEFKRAIGHLYKSRSITISTDGIRLTK